MKKRARLKERYGNTFVFVKEIRCFFNSEKEVDLLSSSLVFKARGDAAP